MKKAIMITALSGFLFAIAADAANAGGLPDYPASHKYQRVYKRDQYWKNQSVNTESRAINKQSECSQYPKSAEYRRAERRMGLTQKCKKQFKIVQKILN